MTAGHEAPVDLNAVLVFAAVAQSGGFTAATERLGMSKARISLEISRLEARLGVSLLTRTTRRMLLTPAGQTLLDECVPRLRDAQDTLAGLSRPGELSGTLRVACTVEHAVQSLAGALAVFGRDHPGLQLDIRTSDRVVDLVREGVDVAIRMGWLRDSSLRATRLGTFAQQVVAAPEYLGRVAMPRSPADLGGLEWVALSLLPTPLTWRFTDARGEHQTVRMSGRLRCDSAATLRALLLEGTGVSVMDEPGARDLLRRGDLVRLLPDWALPEGGIYAVYAPGRHIQPKVRAFIDFYASRLGAGASGRAQA